MCRIANLRQISQIKKFNRLIMKIKKVFGIIAVLAILASFSGSVFAAEEAPTISEEIAAGLAVLQKLQNKELTCATLSDQNFKLLGEYFMGQMMGDSHEAMNDAIVQRIGLVGQEAMHIAMGKRFSGCDVSAALPMGGGGFFPMVQMMGGVFTPTSWASRTMMGGWNLMTGWYGMSWAWALLLYSCLVVLVALCVRWLVRVRNRPERSLLDIVKERYAKGELSKEHFEEIRNELLK